MPQVIVIKESRKYYNSWDEYDYTGEFLQAEACGAPTAFTQVETQGRFLDYVLYKLFRRIPTFIRNRACLICYRHCDLIIGYLGFQRPICRNCNKYDFTYRTRY